MDWFDACCQGGSARDHDAGTPDTAALLAEMARLGVGRAMVTSAWWDKIAAEPANEQLFDDLAGHPELVPAPEVLPEGGERFLDRPAELVADLARRGAGAGVARCRKNNFLLTAWCAGGLLDAMQQARLPLMVNLNEVTPDHLRGLLADFPELPVILQGLPRMGYHRIVYPLLAAFPRLHVVCAVPHTVHRGIDYLVGRFGPDPFLWGSNFPVSEGGASIAGVTYAEMPDAARAAVAGGNLRRLVEGVRRG